MARVNGSRSACGVMREVAVADAFAEAELAGGLCSSCTDQRFLDGGGAILRLRQEPEEGRFALGQVMITGGAVEALADAGEHGAAFFARHIRGDWGEYGHSEQIQLTADEQQRGWEVTDDPGKINNWNHLRSQDRVMSE